LVSITVYKLKGHHSHPFSELKYSPPSCNIQREIVTNASENGHQD
jgi:hypothetical protein